MLSQSRLLEYRRRLVLEAQALMARAERDGRDLRDSERARFVELIGEGKHVEGMVGKLDAQIRILEGAERLRRARARSFTDPLRRAYEDARTMKRKAFDQLTPRAKSDFIHAGGRARD